MDHVNKHSPPQTTASTPITQTVPHITQNTPNWFVVSPPTHVQHLHPLSTQSSMTIAPNICQMPHQMPTTAQIAAGLASNGIVHNIGIKRVQTFSPRERVNKDEDSTLNENDSDTVDTPTQGNAGQILLKMLVPAYAAGSIIGKSGQTITHLQKETGVSIKLSKAKDFYPGTTERIALIQGKYEGLATVMKFIVDKVFEFPIPKDMVMQNAERAKQVKIIVPNTTAGLIIGKKGATIKTIMEQSKAKVQMTQKPESPNMQQLLERVITICGDRDQLYTASSMILTRIRDDPQSASCPNLSYQNITGLVANANPVGSPYAPVSEATLLASVNGANIAHAAAAAASHQQLCNVTAAGGLGFTTIQAAPVQPQVTVQQVGHHGIIAANAVPQSVVGQGYEVYGHYQNPTSQASILQQYLRQ